VRKFVLAALLALMPAQVAAQEQGATLYSKGHFTGSSITVDRPSIKMTPFQVKSLRIPAGTVWELCSGNTFTGCERFSESKPALARTVRSVRPVAPPIAESVSAPSQGPVTGSGPSLRGLASEFFVVPAQGGSRIEVSDKAAGAASIAATAFCRAHGWRMSVYERVQTIGGRTFLADVLCVNEDR
jgi:hypothetical protein